MGLITKSQPPKIAVDISSTAVKLLQLSRAGDRYRVEHYAIEPLPANAVVDKNIADPEAVGEAIRRAIARSGSKARHAVGAVAGKGEHATGAAIAERRNLVAELADILRDLDSFLRHDRQPLRVLVWVKRLTGVTGSQGVSG